MPRWRAGGRGRAGPPPGVRVFEGGTGAAASRETRGPRESPTLSRREPPCREATAAPRPASPLGTISMNPPPPSVSTPSYQERQGLVRAGLDRLVDGGLHLGGQLRLLDVLGDRHDGVCEGSGVCGVCVGERAAREVCAAKSGVREVQKHACVGRAVGPWEGGGPFAPFFSFSLLGIKTLRACGGCASRPASVASGPSPIAHRPRHTLKVSGTSATPDTTRPEMQPSPSQAAEPLLSAGEDRGWGFQAPSSLPACAVGDAGAAWGRLDEGEREGGGGGGRRRNVGGGACVEERARCTTSP